MLNPDAARCAGKWQGHLMGLLSTLGPGGKRSQHNRHTSVDGGTSGGVALRAQHASRGLCQQYGRLLILLRLITDPTRRQSTRHCATELLTT
jgi:hypothetical protein